MLKLVVSLLCWSFLMCGFAQDILIRDSQTSFNERYFFTIDNGQIKAMSRLKRDEWTPVVTPSFMGPIVEFSVDDKNIFAIDANNQLYTMFNALEAKKEFKWVKRWGAPLWRGKGIKVPAKYERLAWAGSFLSPELDQYIEDLKGNRRSIGLGVTTVYVLGADGQKITLLDPWLPIDYSYEICSPERGRLKAVGLGASGSRLAVMDKHGNVFTRIYDFDIAGSDPVFFNYYWGDVPKDEFVHDTSGLIPTKRRQLPAPDWVQQPAIHEASRLVSRVSVHKTGVGVKDAVVRVPGWNKNEVKGFFEKKITDADWSFHPYDWNTQGQVLSELSEELDLGVNEEYSYLSGSKFNKYRLALIPDKENIKAELRNMGAYCSPADLKLVFKDGGALKFSLHHTNGLRMRRRGPGINNKPLKLYGALRLESSKEESTGEALKFIEKYFKPSKKREWVYIPVTVSVSSSEVKITHRSTLPGRDINNMLNFTKKFKIVIEK